MKIISIILLLSNWTLLLSQDLESDTAWIESEAKLLFEEADDLTGIVYYHLELDYWIETLDTLNEKNKIKREIFIEQKDELLRKALTNYEELTKEFPTSSYYHKSVNNRGVIEFEFKMYERAKNSFLEILDSDVNDKEEIKVGYGLMAEPFANYRHRAARILYEIEFELENYHKAREYLEESRKHKYHHWCGNAHQGMEFWFAYQRSKIEAKLGNYEEATKYIIPHLFNRKMISEFGTHCLNVMFKIKTKEQLFEELDSSINNFYSRKRRPNSNYFNYYIKFMGEELEVGIRTPENRDEEQQLIREEIENQMIYFYLEPRK